MNNGPEWTNEERRGVQADAGANATPETEIAAADEELLALDPELMVLERELGAGLKPFALPAGFADRVVARAEAARPKAAGAGKVVPFPGSLRALRAFPSSWRLAAGGAIAASVLAASFAMDAIHQRRERERAQATEQQLETAVQVSNRAIDEARMQLQRAAYRIGQ